MKIITMADLFCGAGGTSTGAAQAVEALGYTLSLTAVNHWEQAEARPRTVTVYWRVEA